MQSNTNIFETRVYELKEFANKEAMVQHLEHKISAVIAEHKPYWNITNTERNITDKTASAKIHMTKKYN